MHFVSFAISLTLFTATTVSAAPKIIIENDWNVDSYISFLLAIDARFEILGLLGNTANSWSRQASFHALALLEIGNLSCIPVHKGADYPLLNTENRTRTWEMLYGSWPYVCAGKQGVFKPFNETAEVSGRDPSSGSPDRISRAAFLEGFPNNTLAGEHGASWMVEQVLKYPGEIVIYSGGSLTNIALATRLDPRFASLTKSLVIMGGYIDVTMLQTTGSRTLADINSDINFRVDPEAAKIVLNAEFPNITLIGNGANQVIPDQDFKDHIYDIKTPYTELFYAHYPTHLPVWDELAMFAGLYPEQISNSTTFYVDVDTAWSSPYYGNLKAYLATLMPQSQGLRSVRYVNQVNAISFKIAMKRAMACPRCASYCPDSLPDVASTTSIIFNLVHQHS